VKPGCLLGVALPQAIKAITSALEAIVTLIFKLIVYLGLYIPLAYLLYGGIIWLTLDVELFDLSVNSSLYIVGLGLSIIASIILTLRSGIARIIKLKESRSVVQYQGKKSRSAPEAPKIYRSRVNRGIIVYEYENRFDLYEQDGSHLIFAGTEYKNKRGKRS